VEPVHELLFDADGGPVVAHAGGLVAYPPPARSFAPIDVYLSLLEIDAGQGTARLGTPDGPTTVRLSTGERIDASRPGPPPPTIGVGLSILRRHRDTVTSVAGIGLPSRPNRVVSASADRTLLLWNAAKDTVLAMVAGPAGFRTVVADGSTVAARDSDGRLWVMEVDPDEPATDDPEMGIALSINAHLVDGELTLVVGAKFRFDQVADLRAVQIFDRNRPLPGLELAGVPVPAHPDGRLAVSRRSLPGQLESVEVYGGATPATDHHFVLRMTLGLPASGREIVVERLIGGEPQEGTTR
jgi:hypothetical protein